MRDGPAAMSYVPSIGFLSRTSSTHFMRDEMTSIIIRGETPVLFLCWTARLSFPLAYFGASKKEPKSTAKHANRLVGPKKTRVNTIR